MKKRKAEKKAFTKIKSIRRHNGIPPLRDYFLAYVIFMAQVAVILKPCSASLATPACVSPSNSTKEMSCFPGTSRTSLKPGNLKRILKEARSGVYEKIILKEVVTGLTGWTAWRASSRWSLQEGCWGTGCSLAGCPAPEEKAEKKTFLSYLFF